MKDEDSGLRDYGISFPAKIAIIIPAFEPDDRLYELVRSLSSIGAKKIIVVNDGSTEKSVPVFLRVKAECGVTLINHNANRGKGAVLKTGMKYLLDECADYFGCVTADADGQHTPEDILRVAISLTQNKNSIILGSRCLGGKGVPAKSRLGNKITSLAFRWQTGRRCADTQTGLRGIPTEVIRQMLSIPGERYEYEMNVLLYAADHGIPFVRVPIKTVYFNNNRASHFRAVRDSALVYSGILKFGAASLISALVDIGLFALFVNMVFNEQELGVLYAVISARLVSGTLNFILNKYTVFRRNVSIAESAPKYLLLFLCIMAISSLTTEALSVVPINLVFIKIMVDVVLFLVSFCIQRRFVFSDHRNKASKGGKKI
jgi:glycosyltransferase involved in cell wall biosynthesis